MKTKHIRKMLLVAVCMFVTMTAGAQTLSFSNAKFNFGDDPSWKNTNFDDSSWKSISVVTSWDTQGINREYAYGWYRIHFKLSKSMVANSDLKDVLKFEMGRIDDADEAYVNGKLIGSTGSLENSKEGYVSQWNVKRVYSVLTKDPSLRWDGDNVLAIRVYNQHGDGGMFDTPVKISVPHAIDGIQMSVTDNDNKNILVNVKNTFPITQSGTLTTKLIDSETGKVISTQSKKMTLKKNATASLAVPNTGYDFKQLEYTFAGKKSGDKKTATYTPKYILTPPAPETPRLNNAAVLGVRPGSPVIYRIPCTGVRPMTLSVKNLPEGLSFDAANGVISGNLTNRGDYVLTFVAENAKGKAEKQFIIRVGDVIALTPAMGWNSWNCWGTSVSQDKVMASAKGLLQSGLADYGFCYMNIDDAWEAPQRNADGTIATNSKFPDMKALGNWLHERGLKFGIYSSPGTTTCGGYVASLNHEEQDAKTWNSWGIDYLKYDWCSYGDVHAKEADRNTVASYVRPYLKMEQCLREQPRDINYSLCQYGMADVWKWGHAVDANSWRTTGDINDSWHSLSSIGFGTQALTSKYAGPGHWNDPDMLVVGKVGWGPSLHPSKLTADEQYTHISLWTLQASILLIGCPLDDIDPFTLSLLQNNEVIAVDQDELGVAATQDVVDDNIQIWRRPLADGSYAIGIFNLGNDNQRVDFSKYFAKLGITSLKSVRDLWRQKDLSTSDTTYFIPTHGVKYIKINY
jgi:alpha-galactosidase